MGGVAQVGGQLRPLPRPGANQQWNTTTFTVVLLIEWPGNGSRRPLHGAGLGNPPARVPWPHRFVRQARSQAATARPWFPSTPRDTAQTGSLAGAARLLQDNAGVLKHHSGRTEISRGGAGQRCCWCGDFQYESKTRKRGLAILWFSARVQDIEARGVRKITTGITGLWRPSVQSDVAFWSFDVGSS